MASSIINQQIEEIKNIMNNLKIEKTEDNELIFGNESENSDYDVRMEDIKQEPGTSHFEERWKRKRNEGIKYEYTNDPYNNAEDYGYKQGFYKNREGRWKKTKNPSPILGRLEDGMLNLDCLTNAEEIMKQWIAKIALTTQIDNIIKEMDSNNYLKYLTYKTTGSVFNYLMDINIQSFTNGISNLELLQEIGNKIYQEFLGGISTNERTVADQYEQDRIKYILNKIRICDMCQFEEFTCQYIKYYYQLEPQERPPYVDIFINKIPYPLSATIKRQFENNKTLQLVPPTLEGIIRTVRDYILLQCTQETERTQLTKVTNCCPKFEYIPQEFGCKPNFSRRGRRINQYRNNKKHYKKQYHKFKPWYKKKRYHMYRKKYNPINQRKYWKNKNKQKYCPKGKKQCKCWICQEEGHYANECPNKNKKQEKVKLLNQLAQVNLEPIEDDIISEEELWYLETDDEIESEISSDESEQYFYQDNNQSEDNISIY
jgi:hypothetical protein